MTSPTCGSWIGAMTCRVIRHGWRADGPSGLALRFAAGVGAAVEPSAGGALVDPPGAGREGLAQPGGVAAGVLDLVRCRRAVDASVGHPAGRQPGPSARPRARARAAAAAGRFGEHLLQVEVGVQLLKLPGSRAPVPAPARSPRPASPPLRRCSPRRRAAVAVCAAAAPCRGLQTWPCRVGRADDRAVLAGGAVQRPRARRRRSR